MQFQISLSLQVSTYINLIIQAVALLAEDGAQILEGHGVPGIGGKSPDLTFCSALFDPQRLRS